MNEVQRLRQCFIDGLPETVQAEDWQPPTRQIYLPPAHKKSLSLDRPLVLGGRGAGKSFWFGALKDSSRREVVAEVFALPELINVEVHIGFTPSQQDERSMLTARILKDMLNQRFVPFDIWSTVLLICFSGWEGLPGDSWADAVRWVADHGEAVSRRLQQADVEHIQRGKVGLVLFDGLDRAAPYSWDDNQALLMGLLMAALEFRAYRALRIKIFLRPDLLERSAIGFPDSSKLIRDAVELSWMDVDIYGLLWQYLGNVDGESGKFFRCFAQSQTKLEWAGLDANHPVPEALRIDPQIQRKLFHALAGKTMGAGKKRGDTWVWLPNHLADAKEYVSPRSFIVAMRQAVEDSSRRDPASKEQTALLWRAIQDGVSVASKTRINEIYEDFPWARVAMEPLQGLEVPCDKKDLIQRWERKGTLDDVLKTDEQSPRLPPAHMKSGDPDGLLKALVGLGVIREMQDGRVNVPDIFRVELKMPRRGGVPVRKSAAVR